ncbi:quinone-dependent dihydroorotate dehydrogenase [Nonlabens xiamenensis]|uniref:quinone-dependent dihydroorotate dehydrogenase n=1 Tax=Nonlabens xiamenensis TaxID=2341043 RepID=UPI000F60B5E6|nr:quinone-dependent dihydroorotate dehydrogenase [Nonlabens xiamenensis]
MYTSIIRPLLFAFDPESVHHFSFRAISFLYKIPGLGSLSRKRYHLNHPDLERELFGLQFSNPVGLAAGFDKDAKAFREFGKLGFGFIEIGTLTPKPQSGNPKPRLFRLKKDQAIVNRMGFNNGGVDAAVHRLKKNPKLGHKNHVLIGGNIGKNKTTPNDQAVNDYIICFEKLFDHVDYFTVNVSSPNTPGLRELQDRKPLTHILQTLQALNEKKEKRKPILLKIAPDLTEAQLEDIIGIVEDTQIDGVIATNTTIARDDLQSATELINQAGGLSGAPLTDRSTEVISFLHQKSNGAFPIIGVGGIMTAQDAMDKLEAGASLVQLYTGFVYKGPGLVKSICKALINHKP